MTTAPDFGKQPTPLAADLSTDLPTDLRTVPIGLSLSGGGYRASVFHLGTLAYLEKIRLLPQLSRLSTVSGGTFTGARYILSLIEKEDFNSFFDSFYSFLLTTTLIKAGLYDYCYNEVRKPSKDRKLISSMANVYAETFLRPNKMDTYTLGHIIDANDLSVKEIIFNTTEFKTGESFQFQKSLSSGHKIGSDSVPIPTESAKQIRIADIVAASSCFPGGFEPMAFPEDFAWPNAQIPVDIQQAVNGKVPELAAESTSFPIKDNAIAIMDGGIFDNQGISSLLLADEQGVTEALGLLIISDVDAEDDNLFPYPKNRKASTKFFNWYLTIGQVDWLIRVFLAACLLTILSIGYELWGEITQNSFTFEKHFFSNVMSLILVTLGTAGLWIVRRIIGTQVLPAIPQAGAEAWKDLKNLTVDEFLYVMRIRLQSLFALTSSVFMDRIKVLTFKQLDSDQRYKDKYIHNQINRLIKRPVEIAGVNSANGEGYPSDALRKEVVMATTMPTALWFSANEEEKKAQLKSLVIAGQSTICFNLLEYISQHYNPCKENCPQEIKALWLELLEDWKSFNENPSSLWP